MEFEIEKFFIWFYSRSLKGGYIKGNLVYSLIRWSRVFVEILVFFVMLIGFFYVSKENKEVSLVESE